MTRRRGATRCSWTPSPSRCGCSRPTCTRTPRRWKRLEPPSPEPRLRALSTARSPSLSGLATRRSQRRRQRASPPAALHPPRSSRSRSVRTRLRCTRGCAKRPRSSPPRLRLPASWTSRRSAPTSRRRGAWSQAPALLHARCASRWQGRRRSRRWSRARRSWRPSWPASTAARWRRRRASCGRARRTTCSGATWARTRCASSRTSRTTSRGSRAPPPRCARSTRAARGRRCAACARRCCRTPPRGSGCCSARARTAASTSRTTAGSRTARRAATRTAATRWPRGTSP